MRKVLLITVIIFGSMYVFSQEQELNTKTQTIDESTKSDTTDSIIFSKIIFHQLPELKSKYSESNTLIREIIVGKSFGYVYRIKNKNSVGLLTIEDLIHLKDVIKALKIEHESDKTNPNKLQVTYDLDDDFQLGYVAIKKGTFYWSIVLEKHGR